MRSLAGARPGPTELLSRPGDLPEAGAHVPRHLGLALVVIAAAHLMVVPDATIVNVARPEIQRALGFSVQHQEAAGGAAAAGTAAQDAGAIPAPILCQALTEGFSQGLFIAGIVTLACFFVPIVTTWTSGRVLLSAAVQVDGAQPCDEALGTCEAVSA